MRNMVLAFALAALSLLLYPRPDSYTGLLIARLVFVKGEDETTERAIVAVALDFLASNRAESRVVLPAMGARPHGSVAIFCEREDQLTVELTIGREHGVVPARQPLVRADPQAAVPRREQADGDAGQRRTGRRLPRGEPDAVEPL